MLTLAATLLAAFTISAHTAVADEAAILPKRPVVVHCYTDEAAWDDAQRQNRLDPSSVGYRWGFTYIGRPETFLSPRICLAFNYALRVGIKREKRDKVAQAAALLAHEIAPARFVIVSTRWSPEVVEYPDLKQITAQGRTLSQTGEPLWLIHDVAGGESSSEAEGQAT